MFEYSYNPSEAMLDKRTKFNYDDLQKIADISNNIWDEDENIYAFLENYGQPFWHIWDGHGMINIEIHAKFNVLDEKWIKKHFKECVDRASRLMLESNFNKHRR